VCCCSCKVFPCVYAVGYKSMLLGIVAPVRYFRVFMLLGIRVGMLVCVVAPCMLL